MERQLRFLDTLARTRSVTQAAADAGMSRASAHRLRLRPGAALFAAMWDIALAPAPFAEGHIDAFADGSLLRVLSAHFRRKNGDSGPIGYGFERAARGASDANFVAFDAAARA